MIEKTVQSEITMKKLNDFLSGTPMTIVSGVFLIVSLLMSINGINPIIDPAWISVIISGIPLLYLAIWRIIYNKGIAKISSALLISIAMIAAIAIGDLFASGEVAFIMAIGAILEDMTTNRARKGLKKLVDIAPKTARRVVGGHDELVPPEEIAIGDTVRILPGESIPVDGRIISGTTSVDQTIMTGESLPIDKEECDEVFAGTINLYGAIDIEAEKTYSDSSLEKLIRLVEEAERKKAPIQRIADTWASWLVPAALLIAIIAYFITGDIVRAVTVLVVFCPCALVLATPTAIMAAIGQATKNGVIIKSGEALERMGKADVIAFDKTGTLTFGSPSVSDVIILGDGISREEFLSIAASAERSSGHPLAAALTAYAESEGIRLETPQQSTMVAGRGIIASVSGHDVICGNQRMLSEQGISSEMAEGFIEEAGQQGKAIMIVAVDGICSGVIAFSDSLRAESSEVLSGDNARAASFIASGLEIGSVYSDLLPSQKVDRINDMQKAGAVVAMVGDGVNDAPALKSADIGIAMGVMGSDIAVDSADIALMSDDLVRIPYLKKLSVATVNTIKLSISLSLCINAIAVTLSVLGLLTPTTGALVHNAGSVFVVLIAALLYDRKF